MGSIEPARVMIERNVREAEEILRCLTGELCPAGLQDMT